MHPLRALVVYPVPHPDLVARRYGVPPDHRHVEVCWSGILGETPVRLLRELASEWRTQQPVVDAVGHLAEWLDLGTGADASDRLWAAVEQLVVWEFAEPCAKPGHLRVYTEINLPDDRIDMPPAVLQPPASAVRDRLAVAFLHHRIAPASLGLDEVELRYDRPVPPGPTERTADGASTSPVVRIAANGRVQLGWPYRAALADCALRSIAGTYAHSSGTVRPFEDITHEPEVLAHARSALVALDGPTIPPWLRVPGAAAAAERLDRLSRQPPRDPPGLSL